MTVRWDTERARDGHEKVNERTSGMQMRLMADEKTWKGRAGTWQARLLGWVAARYHRIPINGKSECRQSVAQQVQVKPHSATVRDSTAATFSRPTEITGHALLRNFITR